jgi:hypothetical protein
MTSGSFHIFLLFYKMGCKNFLTVLGSSVLICMLSECRTVPPPTHIEEVVVYQHCPPGGTTMSLRGDLRNNYTPTDSTTNKSIQLDPYELESALKLAASRKHFQQKIAGIDFGGKFYSSGQPHYFVFFKDENVLIDLTAMRTYTFKKPLNYRRI